MSISSLKNIIRNIPDFPKKGIQFKDITTLLSDAVSFREAIDLMSHRYLAEKIDAVVGIEARGFVMGAALAYKLGTGVILVRKKGKLPHKTVSVSYELEYGTDTLEVHEDAIRPGMKILLADDLLATGGTMSAVLKMLESLGAEIVECCFLCELTGLNGRKQLERHKVFSLIQFDD